MELASHHEEEAETIPMPINTSFVGVHAHTHGHAHHGHIQHGNHHINHHHHHHDPSSSSHNQYTNIIPPPLNNSNGGTSSTITATNATIMEEEEHHHHHHHHDGINDHNSNGNNNHDDDDDDDDDLGSKMKKKMMMIRYRECQKNHAASMGGNARDGCGEFMPSGEEGTLESLTCSACNCHRNFHRKEIQGEHHIIRGRKVILGSTPADVGYTTVTGPPPLVPFSRSLTINMPPTYTLYDQSHDHHGNNMMVRPHDHNQVVKKRFRTKFSQEQKEKMLEFAEKVGWKIQKQEESVIQQFCQEVGVKRRVLKVWMHNNKHNLAKKNDNIIIDNDNNIIINHSS